MVKSRRWASSSGVPNCRGECTGKKASQQRTGLRELIVRCRQVGALPECAKLQAGAETTRQASREEQAGHSKHTRGGGEGRQLAAGGPPSIPPPHCFPPCRRSACRPAPTLQRRACCGCLSPLSSPAPVPCPPPVPCFSSSARPATPAHLKRCPRFPTFTAREPRLFNPALAPSSLGCVSGGHTPRCAG